MFSVGTLTTMLPPFSFLVSWSTFFVAEPSKKIRISTHTYSEIYVVYLWAGFERIALVPVWVGYEMASFECALGYSLIIYFNKEHSLNTLIGFTWSDLIETYNVYKYIHFSALCLNLLLVCSHCRLIIYSTNPIY